MERVFARAAIAAALMAAAIPATAGADKPAGAPGNGPPGPAGNPGHGPKADPPGRAVRAHGAPSKGSTQHAAPAHPAHPAAPAPHGAAPAPNHSNNGAAHQKTTICHATGSATNPYVRITISDRALKAHARHQDGRDKIPAPDGDCSSSPAAASAQAGTTAGQTVAATTETQNAPSGESQVAGVTETNRRAASGSAAAAGSPVAATERSRDKGSLPFTGLDIALALLIAGALVLGGLALRRVASSRRTTA